MLQQSGSYLPDKFFFRIPLTEFVPIHKGRKLSKNQTTNEEKQKLEI